MDELLNKAINGHRLTKEEGLNILKNAAWAKVVNAADIMRKKIHPENKVGYTAYRIINYTNVCEITCSFCNFCRSAKNKDSYVLPIEQIRSKTLEAKEKGVKEIFLQGGVNKEIPLKYYTDVLKMLTQELHVKVRGFSPVELVRIAEFNQISLENLLDIFKESGLSSVPGAGAEILSDRMREILSPKKLSAQKWCDALITCHKKGLPGSANIVFGSIETPEEIIEHLNLIRNTQDITHGFKTFVVWTFQKQTDKFPIRHVKPSEYLKLLALSRLYLDNIKHIEVSILGMGKILGELGLYAGADDINSIVLEENVLKSYGLSTIEEAEEFIINAGFTPYRRTLNFD